MGRDPISEFGQVNKLIAMVPTFLFIIGTYHYNAAFYLAS